MRLPSLVSVFICLVSSLARAQSGDFEIAEISAKAGTFTGKLHGQMRSIRVRQDVEVTINGLKAAFEELEPRMKVRVTSGATVHGTVNAETVSTTTSFDYGLTTGYGAGTPSLVTGTTATAISATPTGLSPGTTYHFRAKGVSGGGIGTGSDLTLTTDANVSATFNTASDVPVTASGFTASNGTLSMTLNFAPTPGTNLMVVKNTGLGFINGAFTNLPQGQIVTLTYNGLRW